MKPMHEQASLKTDKSPPGLAEIFYQFLRIGLFSFGGPAAQISLMHRLLVDEKQWLTEKKFLSSLSFCMLLPGPEAMQLATYAGWRLAGIKGGLIAGLLFVLPGALVILALAMIYAIFGDVSWVNHLFFGIKAAVLVIVIGALLKLSQRALHHVSHWILAGVAFIAIFFLSLPFPIIILCAALYGFFFLTDSQQHNTPETPTLRSNMWCRSLVQIIVGGIIWLLPLLLIDLLLDSHILMGLGVFFSKLAVVTFGGAYAVLAYMSQDVVTHFGWLTLDEMLDGLGLAETTPGPLILVTEFVGFIAAYRDGGLGMAMAGAAITLWVTFIPCFIWIFVGAPYIDWLSAQPRLANALTAITATIVGVMLNLSIWFGLHVVFDTVSHQQYGPLTLWIAEANSFDWRVLVISSLCAVLLFKYHWDIMRLLGLSAFLGIVLSYFT